VGESETGQEKESEEDIDRQMKEIEENPPEKLEDWPSGKAKYRTMGGSEADSGYDEGPTSKLGPSELRYHEDGSVTVGGEEVDNPDDYKGDPIPGGPTDPNTPDDAGVVKSAREDDDESDDDSDDDSDDEKDDD
jgi:hypothetical protein